MSESKYKLRRGSQVREEDFGLLFYKMNGPRLYFISSGNLISPDFFKGDMTLEEWIDKNHDNGLNEAKISKLREILVQLREKGVIIEC
jgi:putative mycofactocin binding protein MftB